MYDYYQYIILIRQFQNFKTKENSYSCYVLFSFKLGDDLYPKEPDYEGFHPMVMHPDRTMEDVFGNNKNNHHMIYYNDNTVRTNCNIDMTAGHCRPLITVQKADLAKL